MGINLVVGKPCRTCGIKIPYGDFITEDDRCDYSCDYSQSYIEE